MPSVIMNSFLRPKRSVSSPKTNAPTHAPAMYSDAAQPDTSAWEMPTPAPGSEMRPEIAPTTFTSNPSRIHAVPRPMMISQCQRDHGRRSSRCGMVVRIVPVCSSLSFMCALLRTGRMSAVSAVFSTPLAGRQAM